MNPYAPRHNRRAKTPGLGGPLLYLPVGGTSLCLLGIIGLQTGPMKRDVAKTSRVNLHALTTVKKRLLSSEYAPFQRAVKGEDADPYPATKQQARKVRQQRIRVTNSRSSFGTTDLPWSNRSSRSRRGG